MHRQRHYHFGYHSPTKKSNSKSNTESKKQANKNIFKKIDPILSSINPKYSCIENESIHFQSENTLDLNSEINLHKKIKRPNLIQKFTINRDLFNYITQRRMFDISYIKNIKLYFQNLIYPIFVMDYNKKYFIPVKHHFQWFIWGISFLLLNAFISLAFYLNNTSPSSSTNEQKNKIVSHETYRHILSMPDHFKVMNDQYNALFIQWEGDYKKSGLYWSITTGLGEKNCQTLSFSKRTSFQTLSVRITITGNYYAHFSPLDTQKIIQSIAEKRSFYLCGYHFNLKGTKKILHKTPYYNKQLLLFTNKKQHQ
jgi:hypothetical protein